MTHPKDIPDLVSFWDFQESAGQPRQAVGRFPASLREGSTPIERVRDGIFGEYSAQLARGQYFYLPHAECGELRLQHSLSVVAWLQRHRKPEIECEAVAGMWNETERQRQYALFLDLRIHGGADNVCGHLSSSGGPTPNHRWCMDAAIGGARIPYFDWHCVAFTYDGNEARTYLDGEFHERQGFNPFPTREASSQARRISLWEQSTVKVPWATGSWAKSPGWPYIAGLSPRAKSPR